MMGHCLYEHFEDEQIGRYTIDHGVVAAVRHYKHLFPECKVKESSLRLWRDKYQQEFIIYSPSLYYELLISEIYK